MNAGAQAAPLLRGEVPSAANPPSGCRFNPRCPQVMDRCRRDAPKLYELGTRTSRCFLSEGPS
ncbi:MAG TPA: oligopeptide/dipeptide ABC transporter ATP-binding protein [Polyangiaceae bacterium]|nr:oligopeptide/dipeptide ABC transporter ATP-binding protein [Polyangiaceae bacterium]